MSWFKLDNAAKIYPSLHTKNNTYTFRLTALFFEDINKDILQSALNLTLNKFKNFKVRLRKGLFWYYFENNDKDGLIEEESPFIFQSLNRVKNDYLFQVSYFGKRVSLEIFHAITDATGGSEFLKTLCFNYLSLKGVDINNDGSIIDNEVNDEDMTDSFIETFKNNAAKIGKFPKAYLLNGNWCGKYRVEIINGTMDVLELKKHCKKYNATITEYLGGVLLYSFYINTKSKNYKKLPITVLIPVNARKMLGTKTLRNFMLYIRSSISAKEEVTLEGSINSVINTLSYELTEDYLQSILKLNVPIEKNMFVRLTPLFIKKYGIKLAFKLIGLSTATTCLSNLGEIKTPLEMCDYIDKFELAIATAPGLPIMTSAISYNNKLVMTFAKSIKDREIIQTFFSIIGKEIEVVIDSNDLVVG